MIILGLIAIFWALRRSFSGSGYNFTSDAPVPATKMSAGDD